MISKDHDEIKVSFIGDLMCEKPLLKASERNNGVYEFNNVFSNVVNIFNKSDYVVGNLETVCAGEEQSYTNHIYSFNTPKTFLEAIKNAGINMVTTANNHCLDRGIDGLKNTIKLLDEYEIEHTGTYSSPIEKERIFIKELKNHKLAFLSYTYGTNFKINGVLLDKQELFSVNLLLPQTSSFGNKSNNMKKFIFNYIFKYINAEQWMKFKKNIGIWPRNPLTDNSMSNIHKEYLLQLKRDINRAKSEAGFVIVYMHIGGQFNTEPGKQSKYIMQYLAENGVDLVVGTHPHVVQKFELFENKMLGFYSLGSFNISPSSPYVIRDLLPDYSIMLHLYFGGKRNILNKVTFTILKAIEDKKGQITVYPVNDLMDKLDNQKDIKRLNRDVSIIFSRLVGEKHSTVDILNEYKLINYT
jgi:poly-gamma-glutamate capsule biosynthesis protein CapA/YwtB (metallophosphatase superfamily)